MCVCEWVSECVCVCVRASCFEEEAALCSLQVRKEGRVFSMCVLSVWRRTIARPWRWRWHPTIRCVRHAWGWLVSSLFVRLCYKLSCSSCTCNLHFLIAPPSHPRFQGCYHRKCLNHYTVCFVCLFGIYPHPPVYLSWTIWWPCGWRYDKIRESTTNH